MLPSTWAGNENLHESVEGLRALSEGAEVRLRELRIHDSPVTLALRWNTLIKNSTDGRHSLDDLMRIGQFRLKKGSSFTQPGCLDWFR
jgi:hypothetical protein